MGIILKDILAVLPENGQDKVCRTDIYLQEDKIAGIGEKPKGFVEVIYMLARWAECSAELRQVFRYSMEYFAVSRHLGQTDIPVTRCQ